MELVKDLSDNESVPIVFNQKPILKRLIIDEIEVNNKVDMFIKTFIHSLNLYEDKKGKLKWQTTQFFTCQTRDSLKRSLIKALITIREEDDIAVRLKDSSSSKKTGKKNGGRTYYVIARQSGELKHILKKCAKIGEGVQRKTCRVEICKMDNFKIISQENQQFCAFKYVKGIINSDNNIYTQGNENYRNEQLQNEARILEFFKTHKLEGIQSAYQFSGYYLRGKTHRTKSSVSATFFVQGELYQQCVLKNNMTLFDKWTMEELLVAFIKLAEALKFSHEFGIYHGDIKTDNFLNIERKRTLHFTDFGGAWIMQQYYKKKNILPSRFMITSGYFLPKDLVELENIKDLFQVAAWMEKMDIFSFGMSLYEMISPIRLYSSKNPKLFDEENYYSRKNRIQENLGIKIKDVHFLDMLVDLLADMLHPETKDRPDLNQVIGSINELLLYCKENPLSIKVDSPNDQDCSKEEFENEENYFEQNSDEKTNHNKDKKCVVF